MKNTRTCYSYPVCPVCGKTMMFTEPVVRSRDYLIHLDCREGHAEASSSN